MKALKVVLGLVAGLAIVYLALCFTGPTKMDVSESLSMDAPAEVVYGQVAELKNWQNWSVWNINDPSMEVSYGEKTNGLGGSYSWKSPESGDGQLEIVEADPGKSLKTKIEFSDWDGASFGTWDFAETDGKTKVTWGMESDTDFPFLLRGMMTLVNMEGRVKADFAGGLANIKGLAEAAATENANTMKEYKVQEVEMPEMHYATVRKTGSAVNISKYLEEGYGIIMSRIGAENVEMTGRPTGIYYMFDEEKGMTDMAAAMPIAESRDFGSDIEMVTVPAGKAYVVDFYGNYDGTGPAHYAIEDYAKAHNTELVDMAIEVYVTDPGEESDPNKWLTKIMYYTKG
ncbi:MAG: SRPBCC family protein [Bacteroidota bacterium]